MKIKYYFLLSVLVLSASFTLTGLSVAPVKALEEPTELTNVVLQIFPEYDDPLEINSPSLLVMLQGKVGGVTLPATIRFLVPETAIMYSAGSLDANGQYTGGPPNRNTSEDVAGWDEISYEITNSIFIIEYYDPAIGPQADKNINYEFHPLYPITDLAVAIQEPLSSSNYSINPTADYSQTRADTFSGKQFNFHQYNRSNLAAGDVLRFNIAYSKSDLRPSLVIAKGGSSGMSGTVWIVLGVLVLVGVGVFFALRIKSNSKRAKRIDRRTARIGKSKKKRLQDKFCGQCRQPLDSSDVFCPNCGAKRG